MFNFIPAKDYSFYFNQYYLVLVLLVFLNSFFYKLEDVKYLAILKVLGVITLIFTILYIGLRPIDGVFVDMTVYSYMFERFQQNDPVLYDEDYGFYYFMEFCTKIMNVETFFLLCSFIYVYPLFISSRKLFKGYWFYSFLLFCISFSFWAYGTNGIRNGMATTLFILAYTFKDKKSISIFLFILSCSFHQTMLLPTLAFLLTNYMRSNKLYLSFWVASIPLSLFLGSFFVDLVPNLGFNSEKVGSYFTNEISSDISKTGFRWDFLLYSSSAVFFGYYYLHVKKIVDEFYSQLFNMYLFCNAIWILVINVNFSNRFAYLSWFLMALIIIYPLLKYKLLKHQGLKIGFILLIYFTFTYTLNVILVR